MDAQIGALLDALAELGLAHDTVVIFTSDHGDGDASHAWNQKTVLFEETVKVPLIIADPRVPNPVGQCSALVSVGLDLLPTLVALAGGSVPAGLPGADVSPALYSQDYPGHNEVVVQTRFERVQGPLTSGRCLIGPRFKYVIYSWGCWREQLFDLAADPGETTDLAAVEPELVVSLRARHQAWRAEVTTSGTD